VRLGHASETYPDPQAALAGLGAWAWAGQTPEQCGFDLAVEMLGDRGAARSRRRERLELATEGTQLRVGRRGVGVGVGIFDLGVGEAG